MKEEICWLFTFLVFLVSPVHAGVITIGSCSTEIVCELGLCSEISGTDLASEKLVDVNAESIGYWRSINLEAALALKAGSLIASSQAGSKKSLRILQSMTRDSVLLEKASNWDELFKNVQRVAHALGKIEVGRELILRYSNKLQEVSQTSRLSSSKMLPVFSPMGKGLYASSSDSPAGFLINQLGALNLSNYESSKILSREILLSLRPDYLLMSQSTADWMGDNSFDVLNVMEGRELREIVVPDSALHEVCISTVQAYVQLKK